MPNKDRSCLTLLAVALCGVLPSYAQAVPWVVFEDADSGEKCGLINAADTELVVDAVTGQLIIVSGDDTILLDTFVDDAGDFFFDGFFSGFVDFATDGDGLASLWLFTLTNDVADINEFTGQITETGLGPNDFIDLPCNACEYWDDQFDCVDDDVDDVEDHLDDCLDTPLDEEPDEFGCSCSQLDFDGDGVNECFDLCDDTPFDLVADIDGCSCLAYDDDGDGVDNCDDLCSNTHDGDFVDAVGCILPEPVSDAPVVVVCGNVGMLMPFLMCCGLVTMRRRVRAPR